MTAPTKRAMDAAIVIARQRVDRRAGGGENIPNPGGLARTIATQDLWPDHHETLTTLAAEHPYWTADELARQLEHDSADPVVEAVSGAFPGAVPAADSTARSGDAQRRLMEEETERRMTEAAEWSAPSDEERVRSRAIIREARADLRADRGDNDLEKAGSS